MKYIVGILIGLLVLCFTLSSVSCTKEKTIAGPTEYVNTLDTAFVVDTINLIDTVNITDTIQTWETATTVVHEWYGSSYSDDVFEFMPFSSIPNAIVGSEWEGFDFGVKDLAQNEFEVSGIAYAWSTSEYYIHVDTVEYQSGVWVVNDYGLPTSQNMPPWPGSWKNRLKQIDLVR